MTRYIWNVLIALDQLWNALSGGDPDETISGTAAKNRSVFLWRILAMILDKVDPGHTAGATEYDEGKHRSVKPETQALILFAQGVGLFAYLLYVIL